MSRFFRPDLRITLSGDQALLQRKRLWQTPSERLQFAADMTMDARLRTAFATLLAPYPSASLQLFLPSSLFVFWNVPWISESIGEPEIHDIAESLLQQDLGMTPDSLCYTLAPARFGQSRMACGLPRTLVETIRAQTPDTVDLIGIQPLLSLAWSHLKDRKTPVLYSEPGFAAILPIHSPIAIHTRRLPEGQLISTDAGQALAALVGVENYQPLHISMETTLASALEVLVRAA